MATKSVLSVFALCALASSGCIYSRILYRNYPTLAAVDEFDSRIIRAPGVESELEREEPQATVDLPRSEREAYRSFDDMLEANDTSAFVVVRDERIIYERYFGGVNASTLLPGFSVTKTYAALLIGCAVADGILGPVDRRLISYVPEVAGRPGYDAITIDHLLRMTSGIDFDEESVAGAVLYYSEHLPEHTYAYDVKWTPGTHYLYGSVSTQILWDVLHRRLGGGSVSRYFQERVWRRLGAEHDAEWALDSASSGVEKFFGGFSATARDHARLGLLFMNGGRSGGRQIVPESWIRASLEPDPIAGTVRTSDGAVRRGKYQWFLTPDGRAFFAKGYHGQYVFVVPEAKMVFVRFGEGYGSVDWSELFLRLARSSADRE